MTEGLFLISGLFIAYVVYQILNEKKTLGDIETPAAPEQKQASAETAPVAAVATVAEKAETPKPKTSKTAKVAESIPAVKQAVEETPKIKEATKPVAKKSAPKKQQEPAVIPVAEPEPEPVKSKGLKDPKSGEVVTSYTNYRFMKRWIKEALVAEGLVDKIYKNDEVDADVETKIKTGIAKLEGMKKYKP